MESGRTRDCRSSIITAGSRRIQSFVPLESKPGDDRPESDQSGVDGRSVDRLARPRSGDLPGIRT